MLNRKYQSIGTISDGISSPDGDWIDSAGNLYVANYAGGPVNKYDHRGNLTTTYSDRLRNPVDMTTDASGNLYVAEYSTDMVYMFQNGSTTASKWCNTGIENEGVAVDSKGNVYVSGATSISSGEIIEYPAGSFGGACSSTALISTLGFPGGIELDRKGDLVVCDQSVGIDVIQPPYNTISGTITIPGARDYFHAALTARNDRLFVSDPLSTAVYVVEYPSGIPNATLGSASGITVPYGVAAYH